MGITEQFTGVAAAKYTRFKVGFFGYDEACVRLSLAQPQAVTAYEEEPVFAGHRRGYSIARTQMNDEIFTSDLLDKEILRSMSVAEGESNAKTLRVLHQAREALEDFIAENGQFSEGYSPLSRERAFA